MQKRLLAIVLCVIMVMTLLPTTAFAASTISFTTEPNANTFVTVGKISGSLTANAIATPSDTVTLTWYACSEAGVISGEPVGTGESFTIPTDLAVDVYFYRCQATCEGAEPVNSRVAAVLVAPDVTFTTQPAESTTVTAGSITGNLTVETSVNPADTSGVTLNWYRASSGGEFIYGESLGMGKTFAIPNMLMPGTYYYLCQATIGTSLTVNSSVAEVTVGEATGTTATISFTEQPSNRTIDVYEGFISEVLTASASVSPSGTAELNWYECTGSSGFVTGAPSLGTGETFAIPTNLLNTPTKEEYYFICQATYLGAAPVNSNVAPVRVHIASVPTLLITTHPASSTTVKAGSISGSLTAEAKVAPLSSGLTPTLKWYECGEDGYVSGPLLSTSTSLMIPTDLSPGTYYYKCTAECATASPAATNSRVAEVIVLGSDAETVATPTFSPAGGTYTSAQSVTLSCETSGAAIYYTDDGSEPTENSKPYNGAISVSGTATLKARAFKDGMMASETASAAYTITGNAASVWIWGKELTSANPYYHNGANGAQGTVNNIETGYNAYFNATADTLTLNGLDVQNSTATETKTIENKTTTFTYAIFAEDDLTINVTADSTVSTGAAAAGNANVALGVKGDLTFTGSAKLTATAGTGESTVGVYILGGLEVFSGTLEGAGGAAGGETIENAESFGVSAMGALTVLDGSLIGTGNKATATNNSISAGIGAGDVTVSGGKITATGKTATAPYALSYGLYVTSLGIQDGEAYASGGTATGGDYGGFSAGVNVFGVTVTNGKLTAKGGHATATGEAYSQSCGVYAEADTIAFSGGTVEATGKEAGYESCGIKNAGVYNSPTPPREYASGGAITVSGTADVTATGGDAQFCYGVTAYSDITVTGGTIEGISNGKATAGNTGVDVRDGSVTVSGGSVTGTAAGGGNFSYGLFAGSGSVTVSGGSVTGIAAAANFFSHGVCASGDNRSIEVIGGTLTAMSGSAANKSALSRVLTRGPGVEAKGRNSSNTIIPVNYVGDDNETYFWVLATDNPTLLVTASPSGSVVKDTVVTLTATPLKIDNPTYQWCSNTANSTDDASPIEGAKGVTYAPPTGTAGTVYYFCVANGNIISNVVGVTVTSPPVYDDTDYYRLSFETNGGSAIPTITRTEGSTVDLTSYSATRAGYTFDGWYADEALTSAVTSVKLTRDMTVYAGWSRSNPFADVAESDYFYDAVLWAVNEKITEGTGDGTTFSPNDSCTRAQMATFLWRAAGSPEPTATVNPFADVTADAYYYKAVLWAVEKGITLGTNDDGTTFSPNDTCTRGQMATFLHRYGGSPAVTGSNPFTDVDDSDYYSDAVSWAADEGVTDGTNEDGTTFSPKDDCTRGQIVTFLYRYLVK